MAAKSSQSVTLVGRATADPAVIYYESGAIRATFTMGIKWGPEFTGPRFFDLELWGKQAQIAADHVKQGHLIGIIGRPAAVQESKNFLVMVDRVEPLGQPTATT
jgi:single-strand DNA-binding protein